MKTQFLKSLLWQYILIVAAVFLSFDSLAQSAENAIIKFDVYFQTGSDEWFWDNDETGLFKYKDANEKIKSVRTVDTLMNYTVDRLKKFFNIEINSIKVEKSKLNMLGKLTGLPDTKIKDAVKEGKYNRMFSVSATTLSGGGISGGIGPFTARKHKVDMIVKIEEYDRSGEEKSSWKKRTKMSELNKTRVEVFNISKAVTLTGNEFMALFVESLDNALEKGKN